jgi:2-amino-4-hydroxy-6-hydroxymethyldihydropteridine diphosphokinase
MPEAVLGLGGNLGARRAIFDAALALLSGQPGCTLLARSRLYETPPLGPPQPDFLNAAVRVQWSGTAEQLLASAQRIEALLGRERRERWGARTLDLDVLHWGAGPVRSVALEVPHRELGARTFALAPLLDVAPELAATWQARLAELGGPPPLAQPGWPVLAPEGAYLCGDWQHDEAELGSQLAALLGRALPLAGASHAAPHSSLRSRARGRASTREPGAGVGSLDPSSTSWASQAFTGPGQLFDGEGRSWLEGVVAAAHARGFVVRAAAVIERDEARAAGVLVGFAGAHTPDEGDLESDLGCAPTVYLERRADGRRRVKVCAQAPERGLDFNGSGTM